ncbi:complement factor B isoform X1 [Silurus meridionalis]|nr:complement factor B isoform X1 [Silurus meridionalis]
MGTLTRLLYSPIDSAVSCPNNNLSIKDGSFTLSKSYNDGSVLRYVCPVGFYPHPVKKRQCKYGQWDPEPTSKRECRKVTCPNPRGMENGVVIPTRKIYYVNDTTKYRCNSDYTFRGSATRECQANGKWSGGTPICSRNTDHCPDPGTPPGASRKGNIFNIDDKVTYTCDKNLKLIGSKVRVCQDGGLWSGKEPECYADFTYDTPGEVAEAFGSSLKTTVTMYEESAGQAGKQIRLDKGGKLDIYIALDASDSIEEADFDKAKDIIKKLIEKISYYEVSPNYEILIFTTNVTHIIKMTDQKRGNPTKLKDIIEKLDKYKYSDKGEKTGTNIRNAYEKILESISLEEAHNKVDFDETQHVIIMFTDGIYNSGGNPKGIVGQIREKVIRDKKDREKYLDLYAFGVGEDIEKEKMDEWVSKRDTNEKYFFILPNMEEVEETLDKMLDEGTSMALCGLYKSYSDSELKSSMRLTYPWLIKIVITYNGNTANCIGSLVTPRFILTAAHCFRFDDVNDQIKLEALNSKDIQIPGVERFYLHEKFNTTQKQDKGITEFYEYDVALIQLTEGVKISPDLRTICVPCTEEAHAALQLPASEASCAKHREMLLDSDLMNAHFITHDALTSKKPKQQVLIKQNQWRDDCIEQTTKILKVEKEKAEEMFTDKFLCTGGETPNFIDDISCKGDSGGPLVVEKNRLFQVGIISWGLKDICEDEMEKVDGRDFHIHLFDPEVQNFLQKYLGDEEIDTPLNFF